MCDILFGIASSHPALADKCVDLERQLNALAQRLTDEEEMPF